MIRIVIFSLIIGISAVFTQNSTYDAQEIEAVIIQLFDAMRESDADKAAHIFHENMVLATVVNTAEGPQLRIEQPDSFLSAIAQPKTEDAIWDEHYSNLSIHTDGTLSTAWMNYRFYRGTQFSHCGVNTMSFLKTADGWKITYIADTRNRDNCD